MMGAARIGVGAAVMAAITAGMLVMPTTAFAAGSATTPPSQPVTSQPVTSQPVALGLIPVGQKGSYFDLTLIPGTSTPLSVELVNGSASRIEARTYAADVYTIVGGGFGAKTRTDATSGATTWLTYSDVPLSLTAGESVDRTLTVTVPPRTPPGQYISSIVVENEGTMSTSPSVGIAQRLRTAIAVSIRVPGALHPSLSIGRASHAVTAARSVVDIAVANTGNARLAPKGTLVVRNSRGSVVWRQAVVMGSFYAGTKTLIEATIPTRLDAGKYSATLTLRDPMLTKKTTKTSTFTVGADR